jgi:hypothetical protein
MEKRTIKIMPDYQCFPLWEADDKEFGNINPDELKISQELKTMIHDWQVMYDNTLDSGSPNNSGFKNPKDIENFEMEGRAIWTRLISELGEKFMVKYFSIKDQKLYDRPA